MAKVALLSKIEIDISEIDDINFAKYFSLNNKLIDKNSISLTDHLFAYQDKNKRIKIIFDLMKEQNQCKTCEPIKLIDNWHSILMKEIHYYLDTNEETLNLVFSEKLPFKMTFLSKNSKIPATTKIIHIELPCIDIYYKTSESSKKIEKLAEKIDEPTIQIIDEFDVDFYKLNPMMYFSDSLVKDEIIKNYELKLNTPINKIKDEIIVTEPKASKYNKYNKILIISGDMIIIWDLNNNSYKSINLNSQNNEFKRLGLLIIDAEWNYNGEYFTVTCKTFSSVNFYLSIIFDIDLNEIALIEEPRSEKVLILESKNINNNICFHLFTSGKKFDRDVFKYGMYIIEKRRYKVINL